MGEPSLTALLKWGVEQGGFVLLVLVIGYFYRRDWMRLADFWQAETKQRTELIGETTKALAAQAIAYEKHAVAIDRLAAALEEIRFRIRPPT